MIATRVIFQPLVATRCAHPITDIYQNTVRVVMRIAADRALAATGADSKVAEIVCILIVVHGQTDAQLATPVTALLHHLGESLVPTTLAVMFL